MKWRDHAACRDQPTEWWVNEPCNEAGDQLNRAAVAICLDCPVRWECFENAVEMRDVGVIRGGMRLADPAKLTDFPQPRLCRVCTRGFLPFKSPETHCTDVCRNRTRYLRDKARNGRAA